MAIAPVNKFISLAVPVAPGMQELYEVPTGTSALLLYAQVAHVGAGNTYPTVTFIQRRESRSTGNTRDVRIIQDAEIPPNDALILVDGRIVLEKTPIVLDRVYIKGNQQNVGIVTGVDYDEPTGIATVMCKANHGFSAGHEVTLGGLYFTCSSYSGITTNVFPDPQQSYIVDNIVDNVGISRTFSMTVGGASGNPHTYNSALHKFSRANFEAVEVISGGSSGSKFNITHALYNGDNVAKTMDGITLAPGELVLTIGANSLSNGDKIKIVDNSVFFRCSMDDYYTEHSYPRDTDPAGSSSTSTNELTIAVVASNSSIRVNVGQSRAGGFVAPLEMELTASVLENSNV